MIFEFLANFTMRFLFFRTCDYFLTLDFSPNGWNFICYKFIISKSFNIIFSNFSRFFFISTLFCFHSWNILYYKFSPIKINFDSCDFFNVILNVFFSAIFYFLESTTIYLTLENEILFQSYSVIFLYIKKLIWKYAKQFRNKPMKICLGTAKPIGGTIGWPSSVAKCRQDCHQLGNIWINLVTKTTY